VANQLQQAMLTDLPVVSGLQLLALYRPAAAGELVGGDWHVDASPLGPAARGPQPPGGAGLEPVLALALAVGDVTGHDMHVAAIMGQVCSMLRQADLDHPDRGPAAAVTAVENACAALGLDTTGTLVHAHLSPAGGGAWRLSWTNAGHPPPLLLERPGRATHDDARGAAFGDVQAGCDVAQVYPGAKGDEQENPGVISQEGPAGQFDRISDSGKSLLVSGCGYSVVLRRRTSAAISGQLPGATGGADAHRCGHHDRWCP